MRPYEAPVKIRHVQIVCEIDEEVPEAGIYFHWFIEPEGFVSKIGCRVLMTKSWICTARSPRRRRQWQTCASVLPNVIEKPPSRNKLR